MYLEDAYGNIIEILSVIYLYTTCDEYGGGGGGGGSEPPTEFDFGQPEDGPETLLTAVLGESDGGAQVENRWYKWRFHTSIVEGFACYSYDKGSVKKSGYLQPWEFISFSHLSAGPTGVSLGHEVEVITIDTEIGMTPSVN